MMSFSTAALEKDIIISSTSTTKRVVQAMSRLYMIVEGAGKFSKILITPFENPQRWIGQNTFPILLLNDDNMIGEH